MNLIPEDWVRPLFWFSAIFVGLWLAYGHG